MNLWPLCAFIWFNNIEKMLLQMTSGFLQLESALVNIIIISRVCYLRIGRVAFSSFHEHLIFEDL
jgi:hypothetical protein